MTNTEHDILCFKEECLELSMAFLRLGQRASKMLRFTPGHTNPISGVSNLIEVREEFNDVMALIDLLNEKHGFSIERNEEMIAAKKSRLMRYRAISLDLGAIDASTD